MPGNSRKDRDKPAVLVFYSDREPYTTSESISAGTGISRRKVRDAIKKYHKDLESFGVLASYQAETTANKDGGRKALAYRLNEQQATFLLTLLKNTPAVVAFKKELVKQFYAMRALLLERNSPIWQDTRALTKETRRIETDAIRELVEYAMRQGSKNAARYYTNISQLANKAAGITNRDLAHIEQLTALLLIERMLANEIRAGMSAGKHYKQIYADLQQRLKGINALVCPQNDAQALLSSGGYTDTSRDAKRDVDALRKESQS